MPSTSLEASAPTSQLPPTCGRCRLPPGSSSNRRLDMRPALGLAFFIYLGKGCAWGDLEQSLIKRRLEIAAGAFIGSQRDSCRPRFPVNSQCYCGFAGDVTWRTNCTSKSSFKLLLGATRSE